MKRINVILLFMLSGILFVQAQYHISGGVFGNGGASSTGDSCRISGTVGQTLCGETASPAHKMGAGFWYLQHYLFSSNVKRPEGELPESYALFQSYPNPFNPVCTIGYALPEISEVTITVYDMMGREAATLFRGMKNSGYHKVLFQPDRLPSGLYFYRISAKSLRTGKIFSEVKKAMYVK
jgi:hypothetical protein